MIIERLSKIYNAENGKYYLTAPVPTGTTEADHALLQQKLRGDLRHVMAEDFPSMAKGDKGTRERRAHMHEYEYTKAGQAWVGIAFDPSASKNNKTSGYKHTHSSQPHAMERGRHMLPL